MVDLIFSSVEGIDLSERVKSRFDIQALLLFGGQETEELIVLRSDFEDIGHSLDDLV
jgi:hypothetical protein